MKKRALLAWLNVAMAIYLVYQNWKVHELLAASQVLFDQLRVTQPLPIERFD